MPSLIAEPTPVWIITDHDSEHFVPILVDYVSEERVFTASALVNGQQGFPLVLDIFRLVVPANSCAIRTVCFIRTNGRHYTHRQSIPIYAGIFLQMYEEPEDPTDTDTSCMSTADLSNSDETPGSSNNTSIDTLHLREDSEDESDDHQVLFQMQPSSSNIYAMTDEGQVVVEGMEAASTDAWDVFATREWPGSRL